MSSWSDLKTLQCTLKIKNFRVYIPIQGPYYFATSPGFDSLFHLVFDVLFYHFFLSFSNHMTAISKISVQHLCGEKQSNLYLRIKNIDKINNNFKQLMEAFK